MADLLSQQETNEGRDGRSTRTSEPQKGRASNAANTDGKARSDGEKRDAAADIEHERHERAEVRPDEHDEHEGHEEYEGGDEHDQAPPKRPLYKRPGVLLVAALALLIGAVLGVRYWLYARAHESTDDAFIDGEIVQISPKVSGHVAKIYVNDNQQVKEGDLIAEIDPRDFQARLAQARAALEAGEAQQRQAEAGVALTRANTRAGKQQAAAVVEQARSGVATARANAAAERTRINQAQSAVSAAQAGVGQARAQVSSAEAEAARAAADVRRYQQLYERDEISRQRLDQAIAAAATAAAQVNAARQRVSAAESQVNEAISAQNVAAENARRAETQVGGAQAQVGEALGRLAQANTAPQQIASSQAQVATAGANIEQLRAQVLEAELQLSYSKIYAPSAGRVTRKTVQEGQLVQPGQPMLALVTGDLWVTANFKESQIGQIKPGQPVEIKVDAYPNKRFYGHVDSLQAGSGAAFSMLPPENATGKYVKVVQRVPVKIVFDGARDPNYLLGPGMSVQPEVKVK
jgi:membrane fusion protein (multidrug efflux system)